MEKIRDLLSRSSSEKGLPIHESNKQGFYVPDLAKLLVGSFEEIKMQIDKGMCVPLSNPFSRVCICI